MTNTAFLKKYIHLMATEADHPRAKSGNLIFHNNVIYSYGYHYPLVWKINDVFFVNKTIESVNTQIDNLEKSRNKRRNNNLRDMDQRKIDNLTVVLKFLGRGCTVLDLQKAFDI